MEEPTPKKLNNNLNSSLNKKKFINPIKEEDDIDRIKQKLTISNKLRNANKVNNLTITK